jgi:hypothetical protein
MAKRPADHTARIDAAEQRRRKHAEQRRELDQQRKRAMERQATAYGNVVLAAVSTTFDIDQLAGILLEARDKAAGNPQLAEDWRRRGQAFFPQQSEPRPSDPGTQPADPPADRQPAPDKPKARRGGNTGNGGAATAAPPPARPDRETPQDADDLLGSLAPNRAGNRSAAEG